LATSGNRHCGGWWIRRRLRRTTRCVMQKKYVVRLTDTQLQQPVEVVKRLKGTSQKWGRTGIHPFVLRPVTRHHRRACHPVFPSSTLRAPSPHKNGAKDPMQVHLLSVPPRTAIGVAGRIQHGCGWSARGERLLSSRPINTQPRISASNSPHDSHAPASRTPIAEFKTLKVITRLSPLPVKAAVHPFVAFGSKTLSENNRDSARHQR
jgi:hypothetical protein